MTKPKTNTSGLTGDKQTTGGLTTTTNWEEDSYRPAVRIGDKPQRKHPISGQWMDDWEKEVVSILGDREKIVDEMAGRAKPESITLALDFYDEFKRQIMELLTKQRQELLDLVGKEVIGEDENFLLQMAELKIVIDHDHWDYAKKFLKNTIETRNGLRYKQRQKLSALRLEGGKK